VDKFSIINGYAVSEIFVDETSIQIDSQNYWLWWIAYEPSLNACIKIMHILKESTIWYVPSSSKQSRNNHERKQIFTDGAQDAKGYHFTCRWLRLEYIV
jgi:hypothetical protein